MKHQKLKKLVEQTYLNSPHDFSHWMWVNHVPLVADKALDLAYKLAADVDIAVAGALLHDFGDAVMNRSKTSIAVLYELADSVSGQVVSVHIV